MGDRKRDAATGKVAAAGNVRKPLAGIALDHRSTDEPNVQGVLRFSDGALSGLFTGRRISSTCRGTLRPGQRRLVADFDDLDTLRRRNVRTFTVRLDGIAYHVRLIDVARRGRPVNGGRWSFPVKLLRPVAIRRDGAE